MRVLARTLAVATPFSLTKLLMKSVLLALTLISLHLPTFAAQPTEASVDRLLGLMNAGAMIEGSYNQVEKMMRDMAQQNAGNRQLSTAEQESLNRTVDRTMSLMREELTWDKMKPAFAKIYMETFDQEEIDGLVAFYGSAVGKSFIGKMPAVMQKSMEFSQTQLQRILPRMMKIVQESARK